MFLHKSLYYSFVHNDGLPRPKFIQFVDSEGNVVEEQEVTLNSYQAETKKICGVWRKMPRIYRKLLKEEKLFAALVTEKIGTDNDRFLAGRVAKQRYVTTELYSSLLEPATQAVSIFCCVLFFLCNLSCHFIYLLVFLLLFL
jgi:chordin